MRNAEVVLGLRRFLLDIDLVNPDIPKSSSTSKLSVRADIRAVKRKRAQLHNSVGVLSGNPEALQQWVGVNMRLLTRADKEKGWKEELGAQGTVARLAKSTASIVVGDAVNRIGPFTESETDALKRLSRTIPVHNVFLRRKLNKRVGSNK